MRPTRNFCRPGPTIGAAAGLAGALAMAAALGLPAVASATSSSLGSPQSSGPAATGPATATLPADTSTITVAMQENSGLDVIVTANPTQTSPATGGAVPYAQGVVATAVTGTAKAVRFQKTASTQTWNVDTSTTCGGGPAQSWTQVATGVTTPVARPAAAGGELRLCVAGTQSTWDQGKLGGVFSGGEAETVNTLPLETYVADTLTGESPSYWATLGSPGPQGRDWGFQELEAQAVAVRSYALADHWSAYAQICDSTDCQNYRGTTYRTAAGVAAAADTAGEVLTMPTGKIASTEYSASTGGYTSNATEGSPFTAVPDTGDAVCLTTGGGCNPTHDWTATIPLTSVETRWPTEGPAPTVTVVARNGLGTGAGTWGGRAVTVRISGDGHAQTVTAATFVEDFGLDSNWFATPVASGGDLHLTGHGHGHGIGMGQWGALGYAVGTDNGHRDLNWQEILAHYYQPATLAQLPTAPGVVGAPTGGTTGYWLVSSAGAVYPFGGAATDGSMATRPLNQPVVGMAATPTGGGYWLVATDGGIFSFGNASFHGSMGGQPLNQPVVGIAADPATGGYWEVAADGGIFSFTASFYGSMGGQPLNQPVVGMAATPTGGGYWLVAADGGIFSFGNASFHGSMGGQPLNAPVVGMAADPATGGYWEVAADGGIFSFDAPFEGSAAGTAAGPGTSAIVAGATGEGYVVVSGTGAVSSFGDSPDDGQLSSPPDGTIVSASAVAG